MKYIIAYDMNPSDPNPHAWEADLVRYLSEEAAVAAAEREEESLRKEYAPDEPELFPWLIVAVKA